MWMTLESEPTRKATPLQVAKAVLSGPVSQGGRYLGMLELANPEGGDPWHVNEANALDYICEQFAEFLAGRPIVVDADVVIGKG